jgi:hypothetical protein
LNVNEQKTGKSCQQGGILPTIECVFFTFRCLSGLQTMRYKSNGFKPPHWPLNIVQHFWSISQMIAGIADILYFPIHNILNN